MYENPSNDKTTTQVEKRSILPELLDRPIAFQRSFVTITGSVTAALFLSQAVYWANRSDGWFWKTQAQWEEETGLSRREQDTARKNLTHSGVLREELRGAPAKLHFFVDFQRLKEILCAKLGVQPSLAESAKLDWRKRANKIGEKRQANKEAETTTETTAESEASALRADSRHHLLEEHVKSKYLETNKIPCPWDGRTGKVLKKFLAENQAIPIERLKGAVDARLKSDRRPPAENPVRWIPYLHDWLPRFVSNKPRLSPYPTDEERAEALVIANTKFYGQK